MPLDTQPLERGELALRLSRANLLFKRLVLQAVGVGFLALIVDFALAFAAQPPRAPRWIPQALMIVLIPMLLAVGGWIDFRRARIFQSEGACCRNCKTLLIGFTGQLALTTGRCGKCGTLLVLDGT